MDYEQQYEYELSQQYSSNRLIWALYGAIAGSLTTFFLDPVRGRRRRALVRDQGIHLRKVSTRLANQKITHLRNMWQGFQAKAHKSESNHQSEDVDLNLQKGPSISPHY